MEVLLKPALILSSAAALLVASSCLPQVGAPLEGTIAGRVVKGPVGAAQVTAYATSDSGRRAAALGTATTEVDGSFVVNIGGHFGPTVVCADGGTFLDEATGAVIALGDNELCALVDNLELGGNTADVLVTPFTTLHAALTPCFGEAQRESTVDAASQRAALRFNDFLAAGTSGFDFRRTVPLDVTTALAPSLTAEPWHGLLLAGLSESARQVSLESDIDPGVRVTATTLTTELVRDLDDGACVLDGRGAASSENRQLVQLVQGDVRLSANTLRGAPQGLAQSIKRFLDGDRNLSGISSASVEDLTRALSTHQSELFGGASGEDLDPPVDG